MSKMKSTYDKIAADPKRKTRIDKEYRELLVEELMDQKEILTYLNKAVKDPDTKVFISALKNVVKAHLNTIDESIISLERIKRILAQKYPKFFDIRLITEALGFKLVFVPKDT